MRICGIGLAIVLAVLTSVGRAEETAHFAVVDRELDLACMALSEDGRYLVGISESKNQLIVWDVERGARIKTIECPSPNCLACRQDRVFVGTGSGSLLTLTEKDWKIRSKLELGAGAVRCLSAPWGKRFTGQIVAVQEIDHSSARVVVADVNQASIWRGNPIARLGSAAVSRDGLNLIVQEDVGSNPGGIPKVFALADFLRGLTTPRAEGAYGTYGPLYQSPHSDLWWGPVQAYAGLPPKQAWMDDNAIVVPDASGPLVYSLASKGLSAFDLNTSLTPIGIKPLLFDSSRIIRPENAWNWRERPPIVAATLGNNLFLFFYTGGERVLYRCQLSAFAKSRSTTAARIDSGSAKFDLLPGTEATDSIALSDDGKFLVAAHRNANLITIWDIQTGQEVSRQSCPSPCYVLCRAGRAYVANSGKGTVRIYVENQDWKLEDEVEVGGADVYFLSAPGGDNFDGRLLASCFSHPHQWLVDTKRDTHVQAKCSTARPVVVGYSGKSVVTETLGSTAPEAEFPEFMSGGGRPNDHFRTRDEYPYIFQVRDDDIWYGGRGISIGISGDRNSLGLVAIPDRSRNLVYGLRAGRLDAFRANASLTPMGSVAVTAPAFLLQFDEDPKPRGTPGRRDLDRARGWTGFHIRNKGEVISVSEPIAVTLGSRLFLVVRELDSGAVYRCSLPAFSDEVVKAPATENGRHDPADQDAVVKLPTGDAVTTFALSEDGASLAVAHEAAGAVSVWDVRTRTQTMRVACPSPRSIIWRGGKIHVANYGRGTVSTIDPSANPPTISQFDVGDPDPYHISAAGGTFFHGELLVICGKYKERKVVLLNSRTGRAVVLARRDNLGAASVSYDGTVLLEQREFDDFTMGFPEGFDYAAYVRGSVAPAEKLLAQRCGLLTSVRPGTFWFDGRQVRAGVTPRIVSSPALLPLQSGGTVVPDQALNVFYVLGREGIQANSADSAVGDLSRRKMNLPDWTYERDRWYVRPSTIDSGFVPPDVFAQPIAQTVGERLNLFMLHDGALYCLSIAALVKEPPAVPALVQVEQPGKMRLLDQPTFFARLRDESGVVLLQGRSFTLLGPDGRLLIPSADLPAMYSKLVDRDGYFVALSSNTLDLLDRKSLALKKRIDLPGTARDVALDPTRHRCFVALSDPEAANEPSVIPRVVEVDESTSAIRYIRHAFGDRLFVDPSGRFLLTTLPVHAVVPDSGWELGALQRFLVNKMPMWRPSVAAVFTIDRAPERCIYATENVTLELTPSGDAYIRTENGAAAGQAIGNLRSLAIPFVSGQRPAGYDVHPKLDLVAVTDKKAVALFDANTTKPRPGGVLPLSGAERVMFSPSGESVFAISTDRLNGRIELTVLPLPLTGAEREKTKAPHQSPPITVAPNQPEVPNGTVQAEDLQTLQPAAKQPAKPKQIYQTYLDSIVLLGPSQPVFTGVAVGHDGYVLTSAEAVSFTGAKVFAKIATPQRQPYAAVKGVQVIRIDPERDLALLKITRHFAAVPRLAVAAPDAGEPLTLLENGGLDYNGIWSVSVTTGSVSNPSTILRGVPYLQATVPTNHDSLGAPIFDSKGILVGLVVRRTSKEGISFCIPQDQIVEFLRECSSERKRRE